MKVIRLFYSSGIELFQIELIKSLPRKSANYPCGVSLPNTCPILNVQATCLSSRIHDISLMTDLQSTVLPIFRNQCISFSPFFNNTIFKLGS